MWMFLAGLAVGYVAAKCDVMRLVKDMLNIP